MYVPPQYVDPWFARGAASVKNLAGMARARVQERLKTGAGDRKDLLARLQEARDENGQPMDIDELTAEALTQLIAGSDTTSNSSCAIIFYLARNPDKQEKLQAELDKAFAGKNIDGVVEYEDCKSIEYLQCAIDEALRMHSTSSMGLPRIMNDCEFKGQRIKAGMECSVPAYTIHVSVRVPASSSRATTPSQWLWPVTDLTSPPAPRLFSQQHLESVWGDPFVYRPERWMGDDAKQLEKSFIPFSVGPRSCVGRCVWGYSGSGENMDGGSFQLRNRG